MAATFLVGALASVGLCYLASKVPGLRRSEARGSSSEQRHLLSGFRKNNEPFTRPASDELLSTIVEGSEEGQLSSRPQSEYNEDAGDIGRRTPRSQQLDVSGDERDGKVSPSSQSKTSKTPPTDIASQEVENVAEDEDMKSAKTSTSSQNESATAMESVTQPVDEVVEPSPMASPAPISLYEASKSQLKEEISADLIKLYIDPAPVAAKRYEVHESLKFAFVIDGVLTPKECEEYIKQTESIGYTKWTDDAARLAFRDCDTIEVSHPQIAQLLWSRISPLMTREEKDCLIDRESDPERWQRDIEGNWVADGTVNSILFSRYLEGGHFAIHTDGFNVETFDRRSLFSIVLYLNDVAEGDGGETIFFANDAKDKMERDAQGRYVGDPKYVLAKIYPRAGSAAIFFHNILHQSGPIRIGSQKRKYIVRSDIMYSRNPPLATSPVDAEAFAMYQKAELLSDNNPEESARLFRVAFKKSPLLQKIYGM